MRLPQARKDRIEPARLARAQLYKIGIAAMAAFLFLTGCSQPGRVKQVEAPPTQTALMTPSQQNAALPPSIVPPPKPKELQDVVKRIFKESVVIDNGSASNFVVGDFNGDQSQDLAVVLKPVPAKLPALNENFPAWIVRDPFVPFRPGMAPLRIKENETLLAVIHGYGPDGWRDPQATQTYLLKNAVGANFETQDKSMFMAANSGRKLPRLRGDLIAEVLRGTSGYLYYDDSTYSWYDPKSFKGEPVKRLVHSGMTKKAID
jgi:hypothetical protein